MKIKQRPEDFAVEELTDVVPGETGAYALYRLDKTGWTTHDAIAAVRRRWKLEPYRVSYGGLKDRHARTSQYLTIYHGPKRNFTHHTVTLTYLGQTATAFEPEHIRGNRFHLVMRALRDEEIARAETALAEIARDGVPNYFDDQRFGSVSAKAGPALGEQFMAKALMQGRFEDALRLVLLNPYEHDRSEQKKEKAILQQHWGDWTVCKQRLPRGHARSLVDYLVYHPQDFKGAVQRLRPDLRSLYLSAYQSYLWNRILARWLERHLSADQLAFVSLRQGRMPAPRHLDDQHRQTLQDLRLPLPAAKMPSETAADIINEILGEEGVTLDQFKLRGLKTIFFSKGERAALFVPQEQSAQADSDELNSGRKKLTLNFTLPRGCYATMVVKRITS